MPVISRLPGGTGSGSGGTSELSLNIFTQPDEPETKDGLWVQRANSHKKIVVDNLISSSGEWSDMTTAPFSFSTSTKPTLFGNKIVTFDSPSNLWSFDGSAWTKMCDYVSGVDGVLCVIGSNLYTVSSRAPLDSTEENWGPVLFKWSGTTWTKVCNIPVASNESLLVESCVVFNGYIYVLKMVANISTGVQTTQLLRSNGSSFTTATTSNYVINVHGNGVVFNNTIYWLCSYWNADSTVDIDRCVATSTGSNISLPSTNNTPFGTSAVRWMTDVFDSIIHMFVGASSIGYSHYTFDGTTWTKLFDMTHTFDMWLTAYNTRLYATGNNKIMHYSKTHDKYPEHTLILQIADTHDGPYVTALVNTSTVITNGRLVTNFNDVFFVGESGLETADPIYYGDGSKWIKFKN